MQVEEKQRKSIKTMNYLAPEKPKKHYVLNRSNKKPY